MPGTQKDLRSQAPATNMRRRGASSETDLQQGSQGEARACLTSRPRLRRLRHQANAAEQSPRSRQHRAAGRARRGRPSRRIAPGLRGAGWGVRLTLAAPPNRRHLLAALALSVLTWKRGYHQNPPSRSHCAMPRVHGSCPRAPSPPPPRCPEGPGLEGDRAARQGKPGAAQPPRRDGQVRPVPTTGERRPSPHRRPWAASKSYF